MTPPLPSPVSHPAEFSRPWDVTRLKVPIHLTATPDECAAIARRLGLEGVDLLEGDVRLLPAQGATVRVTGTLHARVTQTCVVTLDLVPDELHEEVEALYAEEAAGGESRTAHHDGEDDETPEPIMNGRVDLGELLVQTLSLNLNPYPRKPGATFEGYEI